MESAVRQLKQCHQSVVYHDKYIDKFDAISLASIDVDKPSPQQIEKVDFKSLQRLSKEVLDIFSEASISLQSTIISAEKTVHLCAASLDKVKNSNANQTQALREPDLLFSDESNAEDDSTTIKRRSRSDSASLEETLLAGDLQQQLQQSHEDISEIIEAKVLSLRLLQEIIEHYHQSMVELAQSNGVLHADERANLIIPPRVALLLNNSVFSVTEETALLNEINKLWADAILGNRDFYALAHSDLNAITTRKKAKSLPTSFFVKIGASLILLCWSISECYNNEYLGHQIWKDPTFAIFMCFGDLILLLLMWGISMHVWKSHGIDYMRLLDLQGTDVGRSKSPVAAVLQPLANEALLFLVTFIIFNKVMRGAWQGYINIATVHAIPVILGLYFLWRMVFPWEQRAPWLYMLWKVLAAPSYAVDFNAGYVGDLLTSLVRVSVPFVFSIIYVCISIGAWLTNRMDWAISTSDTWWSEDFFCTSILVPVLTLLPLWIRLVQCLRRSVETGQRWPHMGNALKYTSAMAVIAHGTFQPELRHNPIWIACFVGATLFQFAWDVFQDWGMLEVTWHQGKFQRAAEAKKGSSAVAHARNESVFNLFTDVTVRLRNKRMLGPAWVYIAVMLFNLAFRFAWTLTLLPADPKSLQDPSLYSTLMRHIGPVVAAAEIVRRMVWGFYRLEWEQITLIQKLAAAEEGNPVESPSRPRPAAKLIDVETADDEDDDDSDEDNELSPLNIDAAIDGTDDVDPCDWTRCLPRDLLDTLSSSACVSSWEAKLRLIESIAFAGMVLVVLIVAAYPAFSSGS